MWEDLQIRHLSPHTQRLSLAAGARLAPPCGRSPAALGPEHLRTYQLHLLAHRTGHATFTIAVSALRFLYTITLHQEGRTDAIPHARNPPRLPVVLSPAEVSRFWAATPTLKDRTAFTLAYGAGLRGAESAVLKVGDLDSQRLVIRVAPGQGCQDRSVLLSPKVLPLRRAYWKAARPREGLFPGRIPGEPLNVKSFQRAWVVTRQAAGLTQLVTIHTLRHSFATPLWESGANVRALQLLLGHRSLATTALYRQGSPQVFGALASPFAQLPSAPDGPV